MPRLLLVFAALALMLAGQSSAQTTITFDQTDLGNPGNPASNIGAAPYAQVTLQLVGGVIEVSGQASTPNYLFYNSAADLGVFAFNYTGTASISNCSTNGGSVSASCSGYTLTSGTGYDGLGQFSYSVSLPNPGSSTTDVAQSFAFSISTPGGFSSLSQIESPAIQGSDPDKINVITDFASNVCVEATSTSCALATSGPLDGYVNHDYVAVTPEPASCLLFGTGLLGFGTILRKKRGRSISV